MTAVAVTGASGFVGKALCAELLAHGHTVRAAVRSTSSISDFTGFFDVFVIGEFGAATDWSDLLDSRFPTNENEEFVEEANPVDCVIHCAARAHVTKNDFTDALTEYRRVNVDGTLNIARQAAASGVKRFIFISSIGVTGNMNTRPFTEEDRPNPTELYAQSKWEAEQGLWDIKRETGMELVIIRPPLVYGPNAPGNFGSLIRWIEIGVPLPFGCIHNQRSLVALDNLVDLIITCIDHPAAANQMFLAGDGEDLSTTELLRGVSKAAGKPSWLIPIPSSLLMFAATLLGKKTVAQRLLGSLQVDISKVRDLLGWEPPISVEEGLRRCFSKD